jgi:hypothetical protein
VRRKASLLAAIDDGRSLRTDRGPNRLRKRDERFALASLRQLNDGLSRGHHLARFTERRDHRPIGVGDKGGVGGLVLRDLRVCFRSIKLRLSGVEPGFRLFVALRVCAQPVLHQHCIALLVCACLSQDRASGGNRVAPGGKGEPQIGFVDAHQRLATLDLLTYVHKPFDDLPGDTKPEIALYPRRDRAADDALHGASH